MLMRSICVAVGLMFLAIHVPGMADAQSSADVKCTSKIMRAGSKKVSCLVKARAKRGSDDSAVLERRTSRCRERYIDRFEAALERHGLESCTRVSSDDFADHLERIALQIAAATGSAATIQDVTLILEIQGR